MPKQNISPADYPQAVLQQIALLGQHIAIARKRRGETQGQWARRLGVSQPTMARIERGDPSVAMASYVMCMWLVDPAMALADLIAPLRDHAALEREVARARGPRPAGQGSRPAGPSPTPQRVSRATAAGAPAKVTSPPGARTANDTAAGLAALLHQGSTKAGA